MIVGVVVILSLPKQIDIREECHSQLIRTRNLKAEKHKNFAHLRARRRSGNVWAVR